MPNRSQLLGIKDKKIMIIKCDGESHLVRNAVSLFQGPCPPPGGATGGSSSRSGDHRVATGRPSSSGGETKTTKTRSSVLFDVDENLDGAGEVGGEKNLRVVRLQGAWEKTTLML